ncbi:hypothetical protein FCV25MIE_27844, partial [Fagus crenata]
MVEILNSNGGDPEKARFASSKTSLHLTLSITTHLTKSCPSSSPPRANSVPAKSK